MRAVRFAVLASLVLSTPVFAQGRSSPATAARHGAEAAQAAGPVQLQWAAAPPFFPSGARMAVLQGDPSKTGVYTVRLEMPNGYTIAPHFHPTDEHVTVIMGNLKIGMGDSVDAGHAATLGAGDFITAPARAHHFAMAQGRTIVQVHGMGPFLITYVKASDDPRNHATR